MKRQVLSFLGMIGFAASLGLENVYADHEISNRVYRFSRYEIHNSYSRDGHRCFDDRQQQVGLKCLINSKDPRAALDQAILDKVVFDGLGWGEASVILRRDPRQPIEQRVQVRGVGRYSIDLGSFQENASDYATAWRLDLTAGVQIDNLAVRVQSRIEIPDVIGYRNWITVGRGVADSAWFDQDTFRFPRPIGPVDMLRFSVPESYARTEAVRFMNVMIEYADYHQNEFFSLDSLVWDGNGKILNLPRPRLIRSISVSVSSNTGADYEVAMMLGVGPLPPLPPYPPVPPRPPRPPNPPLPPQPPYPPLPPRPPHPPLPPMPPPDDFPSGPSLAGRCADYDHTQFREAKSFAYSSSGLNYTDTPATNWALEFNNTHACGTISEYAARYRALYSFAYNSSGLNYTSTPAQKFAFERVEFQTVEVTRRLAEIYSAIYSFAYGSSGLNLTSTPARQLGLNWINNHCEGTSRIQEIRDIYAKEYSFAYSSSGLNMTSTPARKYAVDQLAARRVSRCVHFIQQSI